MLAPPAAGRWLKGPCLQVNNPTSDDHGADMDSLIVARQTRTCCCCYTVAEWQNVIHAAAQVLPDLGGMRQLTKQCTECCSVGSKLVRCVFVEAALQLCGGNLSATGMAHDTYTTSNTAAGSYAEVDAVTVQYMP